MIGSAGKFPCWSTGKVLLQLHIRLTILLIPAFLFSLEVFSQQAVADTAARRAAIDHIIQMYTDSIQENLRLYDGFEFTGAYRGSAGHPFFEYAEPHPAMIVYEGTVYPNVMLSYDLTRDEVIFVNPITNLNIKLISPKVEKFKLGDHLFARLHADEEMEGFPGEGFYELLLDGDVQALAKRYKKLRDPAAAEAAARFIQVNHFYIKKGNAFHRVDSKRSLVAVCRDRKPEVLRFIQESKLNFDKAPGQMIIKVVDFYNQIKK